MRGTGDTRTPQGAKLSVSHVSKSFATTNGDVIDAVVDVSFDVAENELCALLGPSGCGKSTVLRMVAGLEEPSGGSLMLDGREITGPAARGMGPTHRSTGSPCSRTSSTACASDPGVPKGAGAQRGPITSLVLEKFRNAFPSKLSGGMKQRVAIARTLANDPATASWTSPSARLMDSMDHAPSFSFMESSRPTGMVTHDEELFLADRIVFMTRPGANPGQKKRIAGKSRSPAGASRTRWRSPALQGAPVSGISCTDAAPSVDGRLPRTESDVWRLRERGSRGFVRSRNLWMSDQGADRPTRWPTACPRLTLCRCSRPIRSR